MLRLFIRRSYCTKKFPEVAKRKIAFEGDQVLIRDIPYISEIPDEKLSEIPNFDAKLIAHLERLSLVRFDSEQAVANLRKSVKMAQKLELVDTENIEPMYTVWENQECPVFEDVEEKSLEIEEVFKNCTERFDDYFVTPPGNIALESKDRFDLNVINEWDKIGNPTAPQLKNQKLVNSS
ncbi:unnamed protein product [Caenorhabditis angaria]|uniref:Glutamyl-tRNA(Gln) amidotransferase subunit C, mitochondrial n=1 Tax=Caenorhabditis angaria TaxID=860376 RepID=A0A9P1N1S2_9PELO|nr:unnamed protein product [Caenorhabditis angaria]